MCGIQLKDLLVPLRVRETPSVDQWRLYSAQIDGAIPAAKQKYVPSSGTYPKGFVASGTHVGIKATNTRFPDLAIIASEKPCSAAAVFTKNKFQAAPVTRSRETLERRSGEGLRGIVINSGCANAVTGKGGLEDATSMARALDSQFKPPSDPSGTLIMSTGVIGQRLPIQKITDAIPKGFSELSSSHESWLAAARAICTTDTFPKLLSRTFSLPSSQGATYSIVGMTKGAGMIHPNMATLLGILCTDAPIPASALQPLLTHAVDRSFNSISVDGDTSTNDTVALLSNGAAAPSPLTPKILPGDPDYTALEGILTSFTQSLSQLVVRDGEGATKFVHIHVSHAPSYKDAKIIASTIARSPLVKTALYGKDANWGRILCAIGYADGLSPGAVIPERTSVSFASKRTGEKVETLKDGEPEVVDESRAALVLAEEDLEILVDLGHDSREEASYWTCDFSHEYVTINGDYRT